MEIKNEIELAKIFDHTNLKPTATTNDILQLCEEAKIYKFGAVCVNPCYVKLAKELLKESSVKVCTVIGFPLGATNSKVKAFETHQAIVEGADEIDMVINIGALKEKNEEYIKKDIKAVVKSARKKIVKVILETCYLNEDEIILGCKISKIAGANFVKTSTGFGTDGSKEEHIKLMRKVVGNDFGVKASGGIKNLETTMKMINAGASRIGSSSSVQILEEFKKINK